MDTLFAGLLVTATSLYLIRRNHSHFVTWVVLGTFLSHYLVKLSWTMSAAVAVGLVILITWRSCAYLGTTIMHAYRNLSPEQIAGMRKDTKELMELQKELMGTLADMKPAIEQGAQMLSSFTTFFGNSNPTAALMAGTPAPTTQA